MAMVKLTVNLQGGLCEQSVSLLEPWVRLPPKVLEETPEVGIVGMAFPAAPFLIGPHQRVVRHDIDLQ
eukprot:3271388-Amphidinium_carterae.1